MAANHNNQKSSGVIPESIKRGNPLLQEQRKFLDSLPKDVQENLFSSQIDAEKRAEVWGDQAEIGEELVNKYAWAIPDERAIRIIRHFSPTVEIGCGRNGYWSKLLKESGVDIIAYDQSPSGGGQIIDKSTHRKRSKKNKNDNFVRKGGPNTLTQKNIRNSGRTLFLCYPDESFDDENKQTSLGASCLEHFDGDCIIHVGELYGDTLSLEQAPWGRSSSALFQQRLSSEFHCILKVKLQNYLHVRDTISVWKRSKRCIMIFEGDGDSSDEELDYRDIPVDELLPVDVAAPCAMHLLYPDAAAAPRDHEESSNKTKCTKKNKRKK